MTLSRTHSFTDIKQKVKTLLQGNKNIAWARFRPASGDEKTCLVKLTVMPAMPWWSKLELDPLAFEVKELLGRMVVMEDERALHPKRLDEIYTEWELLIDNDILRRVNTELNNSRKWFPISEAQLGVEKLPRDMFKTLVQSSLLRKQIDERFKCILDLILEQELLGLVFNEEESGEISNMAQEAAREMLTQCCRLQRLYLSSLGPRSIHESLKLLVEKGSLDIDCAERLVKWLTCSLPDYYPVETDNSRIKCLLSICSSDLDKFCNALELAVKNLDDPKEDDSLEEALTFDWEAARQRITKLQELTTDKEEHVILKHIKGSICTRLINSTRSTAEDKKNQQNRLIDQPPIASLFVMQHTSFDPIFLGQIADALYGDDSLVYTIDEVLKADKPYFQSDAVWGRASRYQKVGKETLVEFLQSNRHGILYFKHAELFEPNHIERLANIANAHATDPNGNKIFVGHTCLIVCGQFPIGSPKEIDFNGKFTDDPDTEFIWLVIENMRLRSPGHFAALKSWRSIIEIGSIWTRYQQLTTSGSMDEPLVCPAHPCFVDNPQPALQSEGQVTDLPRLIKVIIPDLGKFDFFISYSWTRTETQATKLVQHLKSRGYNVYFDKEQLESKISMEELAPKLVRDIRSSKAIILFPIQLKNPVQDSLNNKADELRRGIVMRVPAVNGTVLAEWSWQTLESNASTHFLTIEENQAYATAHGNSDPDFITRTYHSMDQLAKICKLYLHLRENQAAEIIQS